MGLKKKIVTISFSKLNIRITFHLDHRVLFPMSNSSESLINFISNNFQFLVALISFHISYKQTETHTHIWVLNNYIMQFPSFPRNLPAMLKNKVKLLWKVTHSKSFLRNR